MAAAAEEVGYAYEVFPSGLSLRMLFPIGLASIMVLVLRFGSCGA